MRTLAEARAALTLARHNGDEDAEAHALHHVLRHATQAYRVHTLRAAEWRRDAFLAGKPQMAERADAEQARADAALAVLAELDVAPNAPHNGRSTFVVAG